MRINFNVVGIYPDCTVRAVVILLKSSYFYYIKFRQKSANRTRDTNLGILDRKIMGLKDRANFGSLGYINIHEMTKLSQKYKIQ